ncbi:MAG TPA: hypothetical protein VFZ53_24910 [Polyangiaceae bacterium]
MTQAENNPTGVSAFGRSLEGAGACKGVPAVAPERALVAVALLFACTPANAPSPPAPGPVGRSGTTYCLNADGPAGRDAYELVESVFGVGSVESPDTDHAPPFRHVLEDVDGEVGAHFVFLIHRDVDHDRGRTDRQRMEIKVYDESDDALKARDRSTFTYAWRVKLGDGMTVSKKATHLFQLKAVGGDDQMPIVTLTGARRPHGDRLELRHTAGDPSMTVLADTDWPSLLGEWLEVRCLAAFAQRGSLSFSVTRPNGVVVLEHVAKDIDLWRDGEFVRPKWGIYRGLADANALRPDEERVGFANIGVTPTWEPTSDCR